MHDIASRPIVPAVVAQHVEDTASLRLVRSVLVRAPHVRLLHLGRLDERVEAHLDGIRVAGDPGTALARAALERIDTGSAFTVLSGAIERRDESQIASLLALLDEVPVVARAAASAVGWIAPAELQGSVKAWFASPDWRMQWLALTACAVQRVDPGRALAPLLASPTPTLAARAIQAAGELGRLDLRDACEDLAPTIDPALEVIVRRAALLLGASGQTLSRIQSLALQPSPQQAQALALALIFSDPDQARALGSTLARQANDATQRRLVIRAAAWSGDPKLVPWLIDQMRHVEVTRIAGEAFTTITGADLARLDLEVLQRPDAPPSGPNDDPDDDDVAMDEDDSLPWPDVDKVEAWWRRHGDAFVPGHRYLVGHPRSESACITVLKEGAQRQRWLAAYHRCALRTGTPLFNCAAPAWRQQRLLAAMG